LRALLLLTRAASSAASRFPAASLPLDA